MKVSYFMKKIIAILLLFIYILCFVACSTKLIDGTEKTYSGTVVDRAMGVVTEGDRQGRAYIIISTGTEDICFWFAKAYETDAKIGDTVIIESAIENQTNLLIATKITII